MFVSKVIVVWQVVIPILLILVLCVVARSVYVMRRLTWIMDQYTKGNYQKILNQAVKQKKQYENMLFLKNNNIKNTYDSLSVVIATSALANHNDEIFLKHINDICYENNLYFKYMWLSVYHLLQSNFDEADESYRMMCQFPQASAVSRLAVEGLLAYQKGSIEEAQNKLNQWLSADDPQNPVLKEIIKQTVENIEAGSSLE